MESLIEIPTVQSFSTNILVVNGKNPGPFTMQGTNTVLVKGLFESLLIDTGSAETFSLYWKELEKVLSPKLSKILITHYHYDHIGGVTGLRKIFPDALVFKRLYGLKGRGPSCCEESPDAELTLEQRSVEETAMKVPSLLELADVKGSVIVIESIETPGHTPDHTSFLISDGDTKILVSGDIILGQGYSPVFQDLKQFIDSLKVLANICREKKVELLIPGHGPVIKGNEAVIDCILNLVKHREDRELQIKSVLIQAEKPLTIPQIVEIIYASYPKNLHLAAQKSILLHMKKLVQESVVMIENPHIGGDNDEKDKMDKISYRIVVPNKL